MSYEIAHYKVIDLYGSGQTVGGVDQQIHIAIKHPVN